MTVNDHSDSHTWPYMASSHDHTWQLWSTYKHRKPYRAKCHSFHFSLYPSLAPSVKFPFIELLKQRKTIQNIKTTQKIKTIQMITMTQKKKTTLKIKTPLMKKDLKITLTSKSKLHQNKLWMKLCQAHVQLQIDSKVRSRDEKFEWGWASQLYPNLVFWSNGLKLRLSLASFALFFF